MNRTLFGFGLLTFAGACLSAEMPPAISDMGCTNCHTLHKRDIGPSWTEIAERYRDKRNDPATLEQLVRSISKGSRDKWGSLPMVANDPAETKRDQIVAAAQYILSLPEQSAGTGDKPSGK